MGGANAIIFLLVTLPQLSLADMSAAGILVSCKISPGACAMAIDTVKSSISPDLITEVCKSSHQASEVACHSIVGRALDWNSNLPVDYLKDECFGSSPKTTTICSDIRNMCNEHKNSESCSEIIPKNTNTGVAPAILRMCGMEEEVCDKTVKFKAKTMTSDDVAEVCRSTSKSVKTACHYVVLWTIKKQLTTDFWKSLCGPKNTKEEDKRLCDEITDVCSYNPRAVVCGELRKASAVEEEKSDSMMLIIIGAGAVLGLIVIAALACFFRKKIFMSRKQKTIRRHKRSHRHQKKKKNHSRKNKKQKGGAKDKKKKKKKKTGSQGSVANSEATTAVESVQVSAQGSSVGQPSTDKKE